MTTITITIVIITSVNNHVIITRARDRTQVLRFRDYYRTFF